MPAEIVVPHFGESVVEATVGRWLKEQGQQVAAGEAVVELETEKVNTEISAEESGVLARIDRQEGETVRPGDVLGMIEAGDGAQAAQPSPPKEAAPAEPAAAASAAAQSAPPAAESAAEAAPDQERSRISPVAQRMAEELDVDLSKVTGSGPGGRSMKEDVEAFARDKGQAAPAQPAAPARAAAPPSAPPRAEAPRAQPTEGGRPEIRKRLSRRRQTIARRLLEVTQTTAMLTTFNEIDMSAVMDLRKRRRESFKEWTGTDLGFMSFFVKAVVGALKTIPEINAEMQEDTLILKQYYDIGIAVGDAEGLVVPVIRDADKKSFAGIENTIRDFVERAKNRTLSLEDLMGGTFSITNGGVFGNLMSTPIINPPQVAILGMHKIMERPVVVNGEIVIRPMMYVALSYDHRVVDGRESVLFLRKVKELIEDPERLLLEG
jgi:2-oxoglutarate dehydrogenase E2 component (dihydrolipoamide succinyltransferase)